MSPLPSPAAGKSIESMTRRHLLAASAAAATPLAASGAVKPKGVPSMERPRLLEGKVAVVYGAAGSIGSSVARAFAAEGAHVLLAGRTLATLQKVASAIATADGKATVAVVDAFDREAIEIHLKQVMETHGRLDISFNLVGLRDTQGQPLTRMSAEAFDITIADAMRTQFLTATAAVRHMAPRRAGVILMLTAQVARKPYAGSGGFGVACAAMEGLCRQLAVEAGPDNIRVVTLRSSGSPDAAGVAAAIADHARLAGVTREAFEADIADKTMLKHMPRMAEIASAAVLMATDRASAITAAVTNVTCGELAD
jgi:NAD(P)-dependent dehydrogenase (short-subunit alcohol dehydrogenase family)